jgi:hypothetical protein
MRQLVHKIIGIVFWVLLAGCWFALAAEGNLSYSVQYVAIIAGAVLVTAWWVRHNVRIYEKKGPRGLRPPEPLRTDEDRLGRPLRWQLERGHAEAVGAAHLVVSLDGEAKAASVPPYRLALGFVAPTARKR